MTVIAINKDPAARTMTVDAEFDASAERVRVSDPSSSWSSRSKGITGSSREERSLVGDAHWPGSATATRRRTTKSRAAVL